MPLKPIEIALNNTIFQNAETCFNHAEYMDNLFLSDSKVYLPLLDKPCLDFGLQKVCINQVESRF